MISLENATVFVIDINDSIATQAFALGPATKDIPVYPRLCNFQAWQNIFFDAPTSEQDCSE